jgi:hypothetical protein
MSDLDRIFSELSEISVRLMDLPEHAYDERAELEGRREALHAEAAALRESIGDQRPTSEIETELESLRERWHQIKSSQIDVVSQQGGSALESSQSAGTFDINRQIAAGQGADELQARIRHLEKVLADRAESDS